MDSQLEKKDTLLALRRRGAELTSELAAVEAALTKLIAEPIAEPRTMVKIRSRKAERARLEDLVRQLRSDQHEVLRQTRDVAKHERKEDFARVYDAMRISKLGVRGDIQHDLQS